jgi:hypothetical protein
MQENWRGHINQIKPGNKFLGWAIDFEDPDSGELEATVRLRGRNIGNGKVDLFREDLKQFGSGYYSFEVECVEDIPFAAMRSGEVDILISKRGMRVGILDLDIRIISSAAVLGMVDLVDYIDSIDAKTRQTALSRTLDGVSDAAGRSLRSVLTLIERDKAPLAGPASPFDQKLISKVYLKTGLMSGDRTAKLGQDGHLFLVEGSNNVLELFDRSHRDPASTMVAEQWITLIKRRIDSVHALGARFIQIIIPDKISVDRELLDGSLSIPTATLAAFEVRCANEIPSACYLSGLSTFAKLPPGTAFRKIDTHLTPEGAFAVFSEICLMLGSASVGNLRFDIPCVVSGDLAHRFFGHDLFDINYCAAQPGFLRGRRLVAEVAPPVGRVIGMRQVFMNDAAPIDKKVIVFGNSFFAGHNWQGYINYWMSCWIREYHFVWLPEIDLDYVKAEKPDFVIGQTIERFLDIVPKT